jgi:hypothetical protein
LEDLIKSKTLKYPIEAVLYLFVLTEIAKLKGECPGATVTKIYAKNTQHVGREVSVLSNPLTPQRLVRVIILLDSKLAEDEIKFEYYDTFEVAEF